MDKAFVVGFSCIFTICNIIDNMVFNIILDSALLKINVLYDYKMEVYVLVCTYHLYSILYYILD
jgi:hypothetical protein